MEAVRTLNTELMAKLALLKEETHRCKELEKANTNLTTESTTLRDQMDKAKVDIVATFRTSQPFFNECGIFYGKGFDDHLKQVAIVSQILTCPKSP